MCQICLSDDIHAIEQAELDSGHTERAGSVLRQSQGVAGIETAAVAGLRVRAIEV